ncbi:MAG TPA: VWA domain-containing protein [Opitutales bacterium]|nr:VWA domain-containing protein [Opitutales bacterium]
MTFQWPYVLIALPFVLGGLLALFYTTSRARAQLLGRFAATRLLPNLLTSYSPALRITKNCFIALGVLLVVVALARPQWGYDWQENRARGVDVVFVLDTSRSMLTPDVPPSRLERAKLAIYDLVQKMPGNRVGLVAFAGDAFLQCPLTLDYDGFRQSLAAVDTNTIARGGTDIAAGLDAAATALEKSGNHKIIVLLTDGEDLEGGAIEEAKTLAEQGVTIYTVGVGTAQGEIIPIRDDSGKTDFVRDQRGELVRSRLDSTTLSDIATATHGFYEPLGPTGEGLIRVYEDGIKKIPEQTAKSSITRQPIERFQWPLAAGTVLLILELLIGTRRPAWGRQPVPMVNLSEPPPLPPAKPAPPAAKPPPLPAALVRTLLLALTLAGVSRARAAEDNNAPAAAPAPPAATHASSLRKASPKTAQSLFEKGDYPAAADAYAQAADAAPQDGRFRYNQGESLYRSKDYDGAAQAFTKAISISDLSLQQRAYYNLGNSHYRLGQEQMKEDPQKTVDTWEAALKDYQNAIDLDPADADARYNHDLTKQQLDDLKKKLEQQKQQQQQNQPNQDQQNQEQQNQQQNQPNQQNQNNSQNQQNQHQQNQPNQPQNSQNQSNQNNPQQNSQNQSNQNQQDQSNPPQNNSSQQNQSNQNQQNQNQQNQNNSPSNNSPQNQSGGQSGQDQNQPDQQKGGPPQNPQNSAEGQKPPQDQTKDQNGQNGNQKPPQNSSGQQSKPGQGTGQQPQPGQPQPAKPSATGQGKEPNNQKSGQSKGAASSAGGQSAGNPGDTGANGTVVIGVMSHEEAMQLLDSLKSSEQKLPTSRLQVQVENPASSNQTTKDW